MEELVLGKLGRDVGDGEGAVVEAPELDPGGSVGALDAPPLGGPTSPLGLPGRQDVEWRAHRLAVRARVILMGAVTQGESSPSRVPGSSPVACPFS